LKGLSYKRVVVGVATVDGCYILESDIGRGGGLGGVLFFWVRV
jgi:hypothetical protein